MMSWHKNLLFLMVLLQLFTASCGICVNSIEKEILSDDKEYKCVLFTRNCGATTGHGYHVSILKKDETFTNADTGNVFAVDHCFYADIVWVAPNRLRIIYEGDEQYVFKKKNTIYSLDIEYINKRKRR